MQIQELFTYMSTFFCIFCIFKYTTFYNFAVIEAKKYNNMIKNAYTIYYEDELEDDELEDDELEEESKELEIKEELKEEIKELKYEDKYLAKYLEFSNEYTFTPEELLAEQFTIINNKHIWENNLKNNIAELQKQLSEVLPIFEAESLSGLSDEVYKMMGKYFKIDETEYLDKDLFTDIVELKTELTTQLDEMITINNIPEFENDARQQTINNKLDAYVNNYVLEMTPLGNVYMRYNNNKKSFEYFSNNTIPYRYLEAVGRRYVMTFLCKPLFVNLADELIKAEQKQLEDKKEQNVVTKPSIVKQSFSSKNALQQTNALQTNVLKTNVLKTNPLQTNALKTNVQTNAQTNTTILLKENANRYTWEGRLSSLMLLKKAEKKAATLSFAEYKLLQQQNKKEV
jgi:hypothetical protein